MPSLLLWSSAMLIAHLNASKTLFVKKVGNDQGDCSASSLIALVYNERSGITSTQCSDGLLVHDRDASMLTVTKSNQDDQIEIAVGPDADHVKLLNCVDSERHGGFFKAIRGGETCSLAQTGGPLLTVAEIFESEQKQTAFIFQRPFGLESDKLRRVVSGVLGRYEVASVTAFEAIQSILLEIHQQTLRGLPTVLASSDWAECAESELLIVERFERGDNQVVRSYCGNLVEPATDVPSNHLFLTVSKSNHGFTLAKGPAEKRIMLLIADCQQDSSADDHELKETPDVASQALLANEGESCFVSKSSELNSNYITFATVYKSLAGQPTHISTLFFFDMSGTYNFRALARRVVDAVNVPVFPRPQPLLIGDNTTVNVFYSESIRTLINDALTLRLVVYEDIEVLGRSQDCEQADFVVLMVETQTKEIIVKCDHRERSEGKMMLTVRDSQVDHQGFIVTTGKSVSHLVTFPSCEDHQLGFHSEKGDSCLLNHIRRNKQPLLVTGIFKSDEEEAPSYVSFVFEMEVETHPMEDLKLAVWMAINSKAWKLGDLQKLSHVAEVNLVAGRSFSEQNAVQSYQEEDLSECAQQDLIFIEYSHGTETASTYCYDFPAVFIAGKKLLSISENNDGKIKLSQSPYHFATTFELICESSESKAIDRHVLLSASHSYCFFEPSNSPYISHLDVYEETKKPTTLLFFDLRGAAVGEDRLALAKQAEAAIRGKPLADATKITLALSDKQLSEYVSDDHFKQKFDLILKHANVLPCPLDVPFAVELGGGFNGVSRFHCMEKVTGSLGDAGDHSGSWFAFRSRPVEEIIPLTGWFKRDDAPWENLTVTRENKALKVNGNGLCCEGLEPSLSECTLRPTEDTRMLPPYYGSVRVHGVGTHFSSCSLLFFDFGPAVSGGLSETIFNAVDRADAFRAVKNMLDINQGPVPMTTLTDFVVRFWVALASIQKSKFAVIVLNDGKLVEVRLGETKKPEKEKEVNFYYSGDRIFVYSPVSVLTETTNNCVIQTNQSANIMTQGFCLTAKPFAGFFQVNQSPKTIFLVFVLGEEGRILEIAVKQILQNLETRFVFDIDRFYKSLQESRRNFMVMTSAKKEQPGDGRFVDWFSRSGDRAVFEANGFDWALELQNKIYFESEIKGGLTGFRIEENNSGGRKVITNNPKKMIPESPLIGAWVIQKPLPSPDLSSQPAGSRPAINQLGGDSVPRSVLLVVDPYRVGKTEHDKAIINSAVNRLPMHYSDPSAPPDLQRPMYEVFAFWYQVVLMKREVAGLPIFAALVIFERRVISLRVGVPGTDVVLCKSLLDNANDISIRWLVTGSEDQIQILDKDGILVQDNLRTIVSYKLGSFAIEVVGGYDEEIVATRVAVLVDIVEYRWPFRHDYRTQAERQPPKLVLFKEGVLVLPDGSSNEVILTNQKIVFNGKSVINGDHLPFNRHCQFKGYQELSASCAMSDDKYSHVVLFSSKGVGPRDIMLTLKAIETFVEAERHAASLQRQKQEDSRARAQAALVEMARKARDARLAFAAAKAEGSQPGTALAAQADTAKAKAPQAKGAQAEGSKAEGSKAEASQAETALAYVALAEDAQAEASQAEAAEAAAAMSAAAAVAAAYASAQRVPPALLQALRPPELPLRWSRLTRTEFHPSPQKNTPAFVTSLTDPVTHPKPPTKSISLRSSGYIPDNDIVVFDDKDNDAGHSFSHLALSKGSDQSGAGKQASTQSADPNEQLSAVVVAIIIGSIVVVGASGLYLLSGTTRTAAVVA